MYILGISCYYHDASASLLKDGIIVAAAEEERFTRKKHDPSFPINSIKYCLESQKISISELDYVGFYEKPLLKFERIMHQHLEYFPKSLKIFLSSTPSWLTEKLRLSSKLKKELKYEKDIMYINHHLAHAASAFLPSPFDRAAILTIDGVGEWTTTAYGIGNKNRITLQKELVFPHSIGLLYSTITAYLGFSVNNSEYKVMGLAAYGNMDPGTNRYYSKLKKVIDIRDDGSFCLNMRYFRYQYSDRMPSKKLCALLGGEIRKNEPVSRRHKDIAAALQMITEDVLTMMLIHVHKETKADNLVMAGGVALNSVFNGKILRRTPFKKIWVQPNSSDGGTSLGAALYVYNSILNRKREYIMDTAYLGPSFNDENIRDFLIQNRIRFIEFRTGQELVRKTARLIYENKVVGWFQGRMEWGPRALGARSILSNACNKNMKEILNKKVKHREIFRPFAPAVCYDDAEKYFECDDPVPDPCDFMLMVYPIKKEWQARLPAVTHIDGSGRLQTVKKEQNPLYHKVIKEFGKLSGIPIIINTSFNIRGEPIVCSPKDAYRCMMGTGIDATVIGNFLVYRQDNLKDIWDSEKFAKD